MAGRFEGKQALILGVANKRSIAWAIAKRLHDEGAELAFTFQGERIEKGVRELAESVDARLVTECDVRSDDDVARVFAETGEAFGGGLDVLVHSVAFAAAEDLEGRFIDTPRDRFWMALDISAYSLVACARAAEPLMQARGGGSMVSRLAAGGLDLGRGHCDRQCDLRDRAAVMVCVRRDTTGGGAPRGGARGGRGRLGGAVAGVRQAVLFGCGREQRLRHI